MADTIEIPMYAKYEFDDNWKDYRQIAADRSNRWLLPRALDLVNKVRVALAIGEGKLPRLPKGRTGDPRHCVIARALSNGWEPIVTASCIKITHPNNGTVNSKELVDALRSLGFEHVRSTSGSRNITVMFSTPIILAELIDRFDAGGVPSLTLVGESK